jgi:NADPH:quinone reductase-like Zn-dependent oxidoreductase
VIESGDLLYEERPDPVPAPHEVLVAVRAAGINAADLVQRVGLYPAPPGSPPDIPGMELAGEVIGLGSDVRSVREGDRVMAIVGGGAQATRITVDESHLLAVPEAMDWAEAGGFPEGFTTAHDALFTQCGLRSGERALVTGAAGGVGTAAVQLAARCGASVVASVRNPERRHDVEALGADLVIDPADAAAHGPYDVVLELIGGPSLQDAFGALATGGRAVVIGVGAGASFEMNLFTLMMKRAVVRGSTMRSRSTEEKADMAARLRRDVLPLLESGSIGVPISETVPLEAAGTAYERFATGGKFGKIVLVA